MTEAGVKFFEYNMMMDFYTNIAGFIVLGIIVLMVVVTFIMDTFF